MDTDLTAPGGQPDGYHLGELLASDRGADLYRAVHPRLPGGFAVKVIKPGGPVDPERLERFRTEVERAAALRHPHILQVFEVGATLEGAPCVVMELPDGVPLRRRLSPGPLTLRQTCTLVTGIAGALEAAHRAGLVHSELRLESVYVASFVGAEDGFAKVLDFGMRVLRDLRADVTADEIRHYAPEQLDPRLGDVDARTDELALAAIAYRMIAGVDAFAGDDPRAVLHQITHAIPRPLSTSLGPQGEAVFAVLLRGLAKRKDERHGSVLAFARALATAVADVDGLAAVVPRTPTPAPHPVAEAPRIVGGAKTVRFGGSDGIPLQFPEPGSFLTADTTPPRRRATPGQGAHRVRAAAPTPVTSPEPQPTADEPVPTLERRADDDALAAGFFEEGDSREVALRGRKRRPTSPTAELSGDLDVVPRARWPRVVAVLLGAGAAMGGAYAVWRRSAPPADAVTYPGLAPGRTQAYGGFEAPLHALPPEAEATPPPPAAAPPPEPVLPAPAPALPAPAPVPPPPAPVPEPAPAASAPAKTAPTPPKTTRRASDRRATQNMVWSDREQRLVPASP